MTNRRRAFLFFVFSARSPSIFLVCAVSLFELGCFYCVLCVCARAINKMTKQKKPSSSNDNLRPNSLLSWRTCVVCGNEMVAVRRKTSVCGRGQRTMTGFRGTDVTR